MTALACTILLILMKSCLGSDTLCTSQGGICQTDSVTCAGGYQNGLCSGSASRRCCLPSTGISGSCSALGGRCQDDHNRCGGSYVSGLCSGGATLRCCTSPSHVTFVDTGDCDNIKITTRDSWGARRPKSISHLHNPVPNFVIHHADSQPCDDPHTCAGRVRGAQNYHMDNHGWSDIGYSFLVGEDGNVYEGRGWTRQGAHTRCHNTDALAASMLGTFSNHIPNAAAQNAVKALVDCGVRKGYIMSTFGLFGHRDANPTSCPGDALYAHLPTMWPTHWHTHSFRYCS